MKYGIPLYEYKTLRSTVDKYLDYLFWANVNKAAIQFFYMSLSGHIDSLLLSIYLGVELLVQSARTNFYSYG